MGYSFSPWLQFAFWYFSLVCSNSPPIAQLIRARPQHKQEPTATTCHPWSVTQGSTSSRAPRCTAEGLWKWSKLLSLKLSLALIPETSFISTSWQRLKLHSPRKKKWATETFFKKENLRKRKVANITWMLRAPCTPLMGLPTWRGLGEGWESLKWSRRRAVCA